LLLISLLEFGLRIAGFGYPTHFLLPALRGEEKVLVQNNQFGWRFFGPRLSRLPDPIVIPQPKPSNTIRIIVFGESAAKGEPQPAYGLPRMLQATLTMRYPQARFEVVNAAMTAINSHAVRAIAYDCASAQADLWVVYMGNNEVVGPFGAGTIFGRQSPPLPVVRASLALRTTRLGQLLDSALALFGRSRRDPTEWRGMQMFLEHQVALTDPRMSVVKSAFSRNLQNIIEAGRQTHAALVVSTVAVNLRDCAPFGSAHRPGLTVPQLEEWDRAFQLGIHAQNNSDFKQAAAHFQSAATIDDAFAELRFRQATCALALSQTNIAQSNFVAARNLDTLRFRCDSGLNDITRATVAAYHDPRVRLVDAEQVFADASPAASPGADLFYEHVHPTFSGNFLLAQSIARQIESVLADWLISPQKPPNTWPSEMDCARALGWTDWTHSAALQEILLRVNAPPFTSQVNHSEQLRALQNTMQRLALVPTAEKTAREAFETALGRQPTDTVLLQQLTYVKQLAGDLPGALALAKRVVELSPSDSQAWRRLGLILTAQQQLEPAADAFSHAMALDPGDILSMQNLGQILWLSSRPDKALAMFHRAVKLQPNFALGWLDIGHVHEERKEFAKADECFRRALACRTTRSTDLATLARFCRSRGWADAALTNYQNAITANPADVAIRIELGETLMTLKRYPEATACFAEAIKVSPDSFRAHHLYGSLLGQQGDALAAETEFRETLRLSPDFLEARLNLAIALMSQGRSTEALNYFREVLARNPTNELALRYARTLTAPSIAPPQ
jgi:tetratricopeptide (TPR) repeat protein